MIDPLNRLPTDPNWLKRSDELATAAAEELGCMVVFCAIQPEGKMGICAKGVPESGYLHEAVKNFPQFLHTLGDAAMLQQLVDLTRRKQ